MQAPLLQSTAFEYVNLACLDVVWVSLGGDAGVLEVVGAAEGGDVGVGVRPPHRDVEQLPRQHVRGAVEPTCIACMQKTTLRTERFFRRSQDSLLVRLYGQLADKSLWQFSVFSHRCRHIWRPRVRRRGPGRGGARTREA